LEDSFEVFARGAGITREVTNEEVENQEILVE
jgi:hypothetical protein